MNELMTQERTQVPATLYNMVAYLKALASMEEVPADLEAAFDTECRTALADTRDKIDAVRAVMFRVEAMASAAKGAAAGYRAALAEELEREDARAMRYEAKLERLRLMIMEVGVMRGLYVGEGDKRKPAPLEGNVATFQFNLMPPSISEEGYDEARVPEEFLTGTVTISEALWTIVLKLIDAINDPAGNAKEVTASARRQATITRKVDKRALLAALKEPCAECKGSGELTTGGIQEFDETGPGPEMEACQNCKGTGKRRVPGAKLDVGRLKLVVK